jgi:hypothetical protein
MQQSATEPTTPEPQAVEITITVDAELLAAVDAAVQRFSGLDRRMVFDDALRMWYSNELAVEHHYSYVPTPEDEAEHAVWRQIQDAAAARLVQSR